MIPNSLLFRALTEKGFVGNLDARRWELLLSQARQTHMTGKLRNRLADRGEWGDVPPGPQRHFNWFETLAARHATEARSEVEQIRRALRGVDIVPIFLKGAAYLVAGLSVSRGRLFSDIDILVPRSRLSDVEVALFMRGWRASKQDAYDQEFYRRWMHELPPLQHLERATTLDVHHTLLPLTARHRVDPASLIAAAIPARDVEGALVLAPEDMAIHAIAHTFYDGYMQQGMRDLFDLNELLRELSKTAGFWMRLVDRAQQFGLSRQLWYALRYAKLLFETPVPAEIAVEMKRENPAAPLRIFMDFLIPRAIQPRHPSCYGWKENLSEFALYIRSHYLRMPLRLLLPHLARKAAMGMTAAKKRPA